MAEETTATSTAVHRDPETGRLLPVYLLFLSGPIIASMISRTVMSFVDFVMVSKLGTDAQAAIIPAGLVVFAFVAFGLGTMGAVNTYVAQSLGRGRHEDCSAYAWQGVYISAAVALVALALWGTIAPFFAWVGHDPAVKDMEVIYAQIGVFGVRPEIAAVAFA